MSKKVSNNPKNLPVPSSEIMPKPQQAFLTVSIVVDADIVKCIAFIALHMRLSFQEAAKLLVELENHPNEKLICPTLEVAEGYANYWNRMAWEANIPVEFGYEERAGYKERESSHGTSPAADL